MSDPILPKKNEKVLLKETLFEALEYEQCRLEQQLHDHLFQHLLGTAFAAKALSKTLAREKSQHSKEANDIARLANEAITHALDICHNLHPMDLPMTGLSIALEQLAKGASTSEISFRCHCDETVIIKNRKTALHAYRIAQMLITDALQKEGAKDITIKLSQTSSFVFLKIVDHNPKKGELMSYFESSVAKIIQYRISAMNGVLSIEDLGKKGTRITCSFPKSL